MSAAGSKVNHSVVFSAVLCCRSLPLLVFLPLPRPLACSGFWWAAVNRNRQLIAKADFFFLSGGGKVTIFDEGYLLTHTGAGSESTGRVLTLMMGVSALSPRRLICGSEVKQYCTLVKTHQERKQTRLLNKDLSMLVRPPRFRCARSRRWKLCVFTANAERRCLLGSWTRRMDDRKGETFLQAKILRLENHLFWAAEYDVERQAKRDRIHARTHKISQLSYRCGAFTLTSTYSDSNRLSYLTPAFQVFPLKFQKATFHVPRTHTRANTTRHGTRSPYKCPARMKMWRDHPHTSTHTQTPTETKLTHTLASWT